MKEYIEKPCWLKKINLREISVNIDDFYSEFDIKNDGKIDLNLLRNFYKNEKIKGLLLIQEMSLRGFKFYSEKENKILPKLIDNLEECIIGESFGTKILSFSSELFNMKELIKKFNIMNDSFFNYIPIKGFTYLHPNINIEFLKNEFLKNGFVFSSGINIENIFYNKEKIEITKINVERKKIKDYLPELSFTLFLRYCKKENIVYLDELDNFNFSILKNIKGFGDKRIETLIEYIEQLKSDEIENFGKIAQNERIFLLEEINDYFKEMSISMALNQLNALDKAILKISEEKKINNLIELKTLKIDELKGLNGFGKKKLTDLLKRMERFSYGVDEFAKNEFLEIKSQNEYIFHKEKILNKHLTLDAIGEINKITRERVRQQIEKSKTNVKKIMNLLEEFIVRNNRGNLILNLDFLKELNDSEEVFTDEDLIVLSKCIEENLFNSFGYFKEIDRIVINRNYEKDREELMKVLEKLPVMFELYDVLDLFLDKNIPYLGIEEIEIFLRNMNFKYINSIYTNATFTNEKVMDYILARYFPNGLKIDDAGIKKLKELAKSIFDFEFPNNRALEATLQRSKVLRDNKTYISFDSILVDIDLTNKIIDYVNLKLLEGTPVYCKNLFFEFEEELMEKTSIDNYIFLYGILNWLFKDDYVFKKNYIYKNERERVSKLKILENYIYEKGVVSLNDLIEKFGWQEYTILQTLTLSKVILLWAPVEFIHIENCKIDITVIRGIRDEIINSFNDDYTNSSTLFSKNEIYYLENNIPNGTALFSVIDRFLGNDFYCKRPHILKAIPEDGRFKTEDIFERVINNILQKHDTFLESDIEEYLSTIKLNINSFYIPFSNVKNKYVQIDVKEYCSPKDFDFDDSFIDFVNYEIEKELSDKEYINVVNFNFDKLPRFEKTFLDWNPYLFKSFVEKILSKKYKIIKNHLDNVIFHRFCLVKIDSNIKSYVDLLLHIINSEHKRENLIVPEITKFLNCKNILVKNLPQEFFEHPSVEFDDYGRLIIKD